MGQAFPQTNPRIAILLATFNGSAFLNEQLNSLSEQTLQPNLVLVSDDGSSDDTLEILQKWAKINAGIAVKIIAGPGAGFAENFRHLIMNLPEDADFIAFCDQDDVWLPEKLAIAVAELKRSAPEKPGLFCGRTLNFTNEDATGMSPLFAKPATFANALVQSIAGGNTMVLNQQAAKLMRESVKRTGFVSHDWWCYLMVSGAGGAVIYWPTPLIRYRQHDDNLVGANNSWSARFNRIRRALQGRLREWTNQNIAGLETCADMLTDEARARLECLKHARAARLPERYRLFIRSGVYRQTWTGHLSLHAACLLGLL